MKKCDSTPGQAKAKAKEQLQVHGQLTSTDDTHAGEFANLALRGLKRVHRALLPASAMQDLLLCLSQAKDN